MFLPISTKKQDDGFDIEVDNEHLTVPFPKKSYIRFFKIALLEERDVVKKISEAKPELLTQIIDKLIHVIELETPSS